MTTFDDILAALEEADYLAEESGKRFAVVHAGLDRFSVVELSEARARRMVVLEVVRP